ncbi:MAG: hypothetical protein AB8F74_01865 [Saprospiraceae bacterium]
MLKHPLTSKKISASTYGFDENIFRFHIDFTSNAAVVQLRKLSKRKKKPLDDGALFYLDLESDSVKWHHKLDYSLESVHPLADKIYKRKVKYERMFVLEPETGLATKELRYNLLYMTSNDIGLCYGKLYFDDSNMLYGIDLKKNELLWKREIDRTYGVSEIKTLNDSILLVSASGLHSINLRDGRGWSESASTGETRKDYSYYNFLYPRFFGGGMSFGLSFLIMINTDPVPEVPYVNGLESNVFLDETGIYKATKKYVFKKDAKIGRTLWKTEIPEGFGSHSYIHRKDSVLVIVNSGKGYVDGQEVAFGKPFLMGVNAYSGEELYFIPIPSMNAKAITDINFTDSVFYINFGYFCSEVSYESGAILSNSLFAHPSKNLNAKFFREHDYVLKDDGTFFHPASSNQDGLFISSQDSIFQLMNEDSEIKISSNNEYFVYAGKIGQHKLLARENLVFIVDEELEPITSFQSTSNIIILYNTLYFAHGKTLLEVDLDQFN